MANERTLSRRAALLGAAGVAAAAGATATFGGTASAAQARSVPPRFLRVPKDSISIQLYTLRTLLEQDTEGTLSALADIGYRKVETAGTYGLSAKEFRKLLDKHHLRATSGHIGLDGDLNAMIADAKTLGHTYAAVPSASGETIADWEAVADRLDDAARAFGKAGIRYGYHNHDFEFKPIDGVRPYDILVKRTNPWRVHLELDVFWAVEAGLDPVGLYYRNFPRVLQYHIKDRTADGEMVNPGDGVIDHRRLFASTWFGIREYIVEHDEPTDALETARAGYNFLRNIRF